MTNLSETNLSESETAISDSMQLASNDGMMDSQPRTNQMTTDNDNDKFYDIPGIGQISYYGGVPEDVLMKLVDWVDGDSSVGDCDIGYDEFEDTWTGTFTGGQSVMFDDKTGFWYES